MPITYEQRVSPAGTPEGVPYTFSFVNQCAKLGTGFTISGTPVVEYVANGVTNDGNLTLGTVAVDSTRQLAQVLITVSVAAATVGNYRVVCRADLTDGTTVAKAIEVEGLLTVVQVT